MGALASSPKHPLVAGALVLAACNAILGNEEASPFAPDIDATEGTETAQSDGPPDVVAVATPPPRHEASDAATDVAAASPPRVSCPRGTKTCSGRCVLASDPAFGCDPASCRPCAPPHAVAECAATTCAVAGCTAGWANCNRIDADGCEADLGSEESCGACGVRCKAPKNGASTCTDGRCVVTCARGFADCDGRPENGCETNLAHDKKNCGACGVYCLIGKCDDGVCSLVFGAKD